MNRQQRRRAILDGHHRSALRAVAFYRAEAREGRAARPGARVVATGGGR